MHPLNSFARPVVTISVAMFLTLAAGCSKHADQGRTGTAPATSAQISTASKVKSASKLGDLSTFRRIAIDVAALVDKGDLPAAKVHIKELEVAWDSAEAGLKPRAADDWHVLDKAIDKALAALRVSTPNQADCKVAMAALLKTFDSLNG